MSFKATSFILRVMYKKQRMLPGLLLQATLRQRSLPQPRGKRLVRPSHLLPSLPRPASKQAQS